MDILEREDRLSPHNQLGPKIWIYLLGLEDWAKCKTNSS